MVLSLAVPRLLTSLTGLSAAAAFSSGAHSCALAATRFNSVGGLPRMATTMAAGGERKIALFDATGTLMLPSEPIGETYSRIARKHGLDVCPAPEIESRFRSVYGRTAAVDYRNLKGTPHLVVAREVSWWRQVVKEVFSARVAMEQAFEPCFEELFAVFGTAEAWKLYPETMSVLEQLSKDGWTIGVCSNFDHRLPSLLEQLGVMDLAEFVVLPGDCGCLKPDREIFSTALQRAGVGPNHEGPVTCIHVGDSISADVLGAVEAGLLPVLVDRRGKYTTAPPPPPFPPACAIVNSLLPVVEAAASAPPLQQLPWRENKGPRFLVSPDDIS